MVTAADLLEKWTMGNPTVSQIANTPNSFQLTGYGVNTTDLDTGVNTKVTFYSKDCQNDGLSVPNPEYLVPGEYFSDSVGVGAPVFGPVRFYAEQSDVKLSFQFDPKKLSNDNKIYGVVDDNYLSDRLNEINADIELYSTDISSYNDYTSYKGFGALRICVRSSLGYGGTLGSGYNGEEFEGDTDFKEVNFIESLITVVYDFENNFELVAFNVEPKQKQELVVAKGKYGLVAWLCDKTETPTTVYYAGDFLGAINHVYPAVMNQTLSDGGTSYFNQGALITACVRPDVPAWKEGLRMNYISEFNWTRDDLQTTATYLESTDAVTQKAIVKVVDDADVITGGTAAGNSLTSYLDCDLAYCDFSSILFADFYVTRGVVKGAGKATLKFDDSPDTRVRRLGAPEDEYIRRLQEDGDASPFDISVSVDAVDEGPGAIKTAGGASFGITTLASFIALLSVSLLG